MPDDVCDLCGAPGPTTLCGGCHWRYCEDCAGDGACVACEEESGDWGDEDEEE